VSASRLALGALCVGAALTSCAPERPRLTFWAMGHEGERVGAILAPFAREHPHIDLDIQVIPFASAHDKLLTAHAGRSTPDVCQLGNTWVAEFVAMNALASLDERVAASKVIDPGDYFEGVWRGNVVDGRLWGLPWYVESRALFYRTDLFAEAGFPRAPETWAELSAATKAITRDADGDGRPERYGISLPPNPKGSPIPLFFAWQNGADLLDATLTHAAVETPAFREALDHYVDFFRRGVSPREIGALTNFYQAFADGAFASFVSGPWEVKGLRDRAPQIDGRWAVAPLPAKEAGGSRASLAGGSSLVVFRTADPAAEAWALVEYLSRPEVQLAFYQATLDLPARRSSWRAPVLADDPHARAFYVQLEHARPPPQVPEWEQLADRLGRWVEQLVHGESTTEEATLGLSRDIDAILEKRRWLLSRRRGAAAKGTAP
jgi:multiple sugar transport system substrate-binding protein